MEELMCTTCDKYLGWATYSGPTGFYYCHDCKEEEDRLDAEAEAAEAAEANT